jgi:hypothetical protein
MAWPVGDEGDERCARGASCEIVEQGADGLDDLEVRPLVVAADVVRLAWTPTF